MNTLAATYFDDKQRRMQIQMAAAWRRHVIELDVYVGDDSGESK